MNENINLSEILKGHEDETFYSPTFGNCKLRFISDVLYFEGINSKLSFNVDVDGTYCKDGEICIFPSKEQRDWNKWVEEQNYKVPKTWSQYIKTNTIRPYAALRNTKGYNIPVDDSPIEKSALALLKIHQLIEVSYGGNVINDEWIDRDITKYFISFSNDNIIGIEKTILSEEFSHIAFHTKEQAEEFLSYPENIELLKDYFTI